MVFSEVNSAEFRIFDRRCLRRFPALSLLLTSVSVKSMSPSSLVLLLLLLVLINRNSSQKVWS